MPRLLPARPCAKTTTIIEPNMTYLNVGASDAGKTPAAARPNPITETSNTTHSSASQNASSGLPSRKRMYAFVNRPVSIWIKPSVIDMTMIVLMSMDESRIALYVPSGRRIGVMNV